MPAIPPGQAPHPCTPRYASPPGQNTCKQQPPRPELQPKRRILPPLQGRKGSRARMSLRIDPATALSRKLHARRAA